MDRSDAVYNASRCALLVHALSCGHSDLLGEAMKDRWHQPYRAALYTHLDPVMTAALNAGAYGTSLSGSGPSVIALVAPTNSATVATAMKRAAENLGIDCSADVLAIDFAGAKVLSRVL
jgi:homoserine kinase